MNSVNEDLDNKTKKKKIRKMNQMISEKLKNVNNDDTLDSEQVDLSVELYPIRHYIDDKEEMLEQMFTSLGPTLIQNMLPPLLKADPIHELKADCLIQLLGMSKKRILTVIEGKELESSSDSDIDSDNSSLKEEVVRTKTARNKHQSQLKPMKKIKYIIDADTLDISINNDDDLDSLSLSDAESITVPKKRKIVEKPKKSRHKSLKVGTLSSRKDASNSKMETSSGINTLHEGEGDKVEKTSLKNGENIDINPKQGQTLLEILELEMRAKAIRSLLNQNSSSSQAGKEDQEKKTISDKHETCTDEIEIIENDKHSEVIEILDTEQEDLLEPVRKEVENIPKNNPEAVEFSVESVSSSTNTDSSDKTAEQGNKTKSQVSTSWTERYLENKETEKLMKTSKMCTNIRRRMRLVQSMKQMEKEKVKKKMEIPVVIGSISEYQKLICTDSLNKLSTETKERSTESPSQSELKEESTAAVVVKKGALDTTSSVSYDDKIDIASSDVLEIDVSSAVLVLDQEESNSTFNVSCSSENLVTKIEKSQDIDEKNHKDENVKESTSVFQKENDGKNSDVPHQKGGVDKNAEDNQNVLKIVSSASIKEEVLEEFSDSNLVLNVSSSMKQTSSVISEESVDNVTHEKEC